MTKPIDIGLYRKSSKTSRIHREAPIRRLASVEHVLTGAKKRGFLLIPDASVPMTFSVVTLRSELVGSCEFSHDGALLGYSVISMSEGKYSTKEVGRQAHNSVGLTSLLFEDLAAL